MEERKEMLKRSIIEIANNIKDAEKGELLYKILSLTEILPISECQWTWDYLSDLYLS